MKAARRLIAFLVVALTLSGCAYKPLKAPCSPDEGGQSMAYAGPPAVATPEPFRSLDACGPMKPI